MLAGDIESNPGPTSNQSVGSVKMESALERLEVGQTSILDGLKLIVNRLDKFEEELVNVKMDVTETIGREQCLFFIHFCCPHSGTTLKQHISACFSKLIM